MKAMRLITTIDDHSSELGLTIKGIEHKKFLSASQNGFLMAHDIIEHQNGHNAIGSVGDEIQALGGSWFVRGEIGDTRGANGSWASARSPLDILAEDLAVLCELYVESGIPMRSKILNTHDHDSDADFDEMIRQARKMALGEFEYHDDEVDQDRLRYFLASSKHLLRTGYRKASRRFNHDGIAANNQFWTIEQAVQKHGVEAIEFEGQEFILTYGNGEASCRDMTKSLDGYFY